MAAKKVTQAQKRALEMLAEPGAMLIAFPHMFSHGIHTYKSSVSIQRAVSARLASAGYIAYWGPWRSGEEWRITDAGRMALVS